MKIKRIVLKKERIAEIKERMSNPMLGGSERDIERETERAEIRYKLNYDALGIESNEYFFQNQTKIYAYHSIFGMKFDSGSFVNRDNQQMENFLTKIIFDGLARYLRGGIRTLFLWLENPLTTQDFIEKEFELSDEMYSVKTSTPARYIMMDFEKSENVGFLKGFPLSQILQKTEERQKGEVGLKILSGEDAMKFIDDMIKKHTKK